MTLRRLAVVRSIGERIASVEQKRCALNEYPEGKYSEFWLLSTVASGELHQIVTKLGGHENRPKMCCDISRNISGYAVLGFQ